MGTRSIFSDTTPTACLFLILTIDSTDLKNRFSPCFFINQVHEYTNFNDITYHEFIEFTPIL